MGWTEEPLRGRIRDFVISKFKEPPLDVAIVNRCEVYIAVKNGDQVYAEVWLIQIKPKNLYEDTRICYKDMTEDMGPNIDACPIRILNLLTPSIIGYSEGWRARCWARIMSRRKRSTQDIDKDIKYLTGGIEKLSEKSFLRDALASHLEKKGYTSEQIFNGLAKIWGFNIL